MTAPTISQSGRRAVTLSGVEVRAAGDGGVVVRGHAAVFDTPTMIGPVGVGFEEVIAPGAFKRTLDQGADVRFLFNHNPDLVLARTKSGTLKLHEDRVGLAVEAQLAPTSVGRDLAILLERGDVSQMSFGFRVVQDKWDTVKRDGVTVERRTVLEAQLLDVSGVTYPAYDETDLALREATLARELRDARTPKTSEDPAPATPAAPPPGDNGTTSDPGKPGVDSSEQSDPAEATPVLDEPQPSTEQRSTSVSNTLYDERARIWHKMKALLNETNGRPMSGEEQQSWQRMEQDMETVTRSIEIHEKGKQLGAMLEAPAEAPVTTRGADNASHPAAPFNAASTAAGRVLSGGSEIPGDIQKRYNYERAFEHYMRRGFDRMDAEERQLLEAEYRDLSVGTNTAGGYTVPADFARRITDAMKAFGGMIEAANVIETESGASLPWPTADDTGNVGAILAENTAAPTQDITFGQKSLGAYMYTSKMVKVSFQLLNDSAFNLNEWLPQKFAQRIGRAINAHFTVGTGGGTQPVGLIPNLSVGKAGAAGQVLTVTGDDLIDLEHSIDPAYRANARFMMSDSTVKVVRKLKDGQGNYLWQPGLQQGQPSTLNGYAVVINQDMPVPAANAKSIAFGDFRQAYVVRRVQGIQTLRFGERYADALQVGFLSFARYDGTVDDANAAKVYQHPAA